MTAQMTPTEMQVAQRLHHAGLPRPAATLAVAMVTREHSRPENELIHIVRQYQWLESPQEARDAVADLKRREWLVERSSYGTMLLQQHAYLRKKIADFLGDDSVKELLKSIRSTVDPYVSIIGSMSDDFVYTSYLDLLASAGSEICLPMLSTSPQLGSADVLKQRAKSGVHVRILLGSPTVVATLRGNGMKKTAEDAIRGWSEHAKGVPNIEVRVAHEVTDTYIATCLLIDGRTLRFDVYDPHKQRSLQGTLVQFDATAGLDLNICRIFASYFNEAWDRARPVGLFSSVWWWIKRYWNFWVGLAFCMAAFSTSNAVVQGIFVSISAGLWANGILNAFNDLAKWVRSLFRR